MALAGFLVQGCVYKCCTYAHRHTFNVSVVWNSNSQHSYEKSNPVRRVKGDDLEKRALLLGLGRASLFSSSVSDISFVRLLWEGFKNNYLLSIVQRRTRMPLISAALCVCVLWGTGPCSHSVGCLPSSLSQSQWEAVLLLEVSRNKPFNSWVCLWKYLLSLFPYFPAAKWRFPAAIQFGFKCWVTVARGLSKQSAVFCLYIYCVYF